MKITCHYFTSYNINGNEAATFCDITNHKRSSRAVSGHFSHVKIKKERILSKWKYNYEDSPCPKQQFVEIDINTWKLLSWKGLREKEKRDERIKWEVSSTGKGERSITSIKMRRKKKSNCLEIWYISINNQSHFDSLCSIHFSENEDTPLEILARGPQAVEAYERAIAYGSAEICRTRIVLVGQERVGKTSLLKNLLQIQ